MSPLFNSTYWHAFSPSFMDPVNVCFCENGEIKVLTRLLAHTHILLRRVQYVKCTYRGLIIHFAKVDFWRETTNCVFRNISVYYFLPFHGMDDFWKKVHTGCSTWNIVISNGCNDKISNRTLCKLDSFNFFLVKEYTLHRIPITTFQIL